MDVQRFAVLVTVMLEISLVKPAHADNFTSASINGFCSQSLSGEAPTASCEWMSGLGDSAGGSSSAFAKFGTLGADALSTADSVYPAYGYYIVNSSALARSTDVFHIPSTMPAGTFFLSASLDGSNTISAVSNTPGGHPSGIASAGGTITLDMLTSENQSGQCVKQASGPGPQSASCVTEVNYNPGDLIYLSFSLAVSANTQWLTDYGSITAGAAYSHTAQITGFWLTDLSGDPIDPSGVTTESGFNYNQAEPSPVPEPCSLMLLGASFITILFQPFRTTRRKSVPA